MSTGGDRDRMNKDCYISILNIIQVSVILPLAMLQRIILYTDSDPAQIFYTNPADLDPKHCPLCPLVCIRSIYWHCYIWYNYLSVIN